MSNVAVLAVCVSERRGTVKKEVPEITLRINHGIVGDAHAGSWHRQVSLLASESVEKARSALSARRAKAAEAAGTAACEASGNALWELPPGAFAENILTQGIVLYELPVGTILNVGESQLEVTQIGKECHASCEIRKLVGDCVMPREGIFAKVIKEGSVRAGDQITIEKR